MPGDVEQLREYYYETLGGGNRVLRGVLHQSRDLVGVEWVVLERAVSLLEGQGCQGGGLGILRFRFYCTQL